MISTSPASAIGSALTPGRPSSARDNRLARSSKPTVLASGLLKRRQLASDVTVPVWCSVAETATQFRLTHRGATSSACRSPVLELLPRIVLSGESAAFSILSGCSPSYTRAVFAHPMMRRIELIVDQAVADDADRTYSWFVFPGYPNSNKQQQYSQYNQPRPEIVPSSKWCFQILGPPAQTWLR